jgi:hypothetical protein
MSEAKIQESVGDGGMNQPDDVKVIQTLLNTMGDFGFFEVTGIVDDTLISAIRRFQSDFLQEPDGRIDPGGKSFTRLLRIVTLGFQLLPQLSGNGYYSYSEFAKQYATPATIQMLLEVSTEFSGAVPAKLLGIGDISFRNGAEMPPHTSHRNGRNIDIRPVRTDGAMRGVSIGDDEYSREDTRLLVNLLLAKGNVRKILFNDTAIVGVRQFPGHHNHLHIETTA